MNISVQRASELAGGRSVNCAEEKITSVVTDTRKVTHGSLFVALKGDNFDGHDFAVTAVKNGAAAVMSQRPEALYDQKLPLIEVKDTYAALLSLAGGYRNGFNTTIVGITGSVGKTTVKDMTASVLSRKMKTAKTQGNLNNHIGVPQTLLSLEGDEKAAVIEMGMNHFGEISRLTAAVKPDVAVITCIGVSHIENLGSRENILKAKLEILEGMKSGAPLIVDGDNDLLASLESTREHPVLKTSCQGSEAYVCARDIKESADGIDFSIYTKDGLLTEAHLNLPGRHNLHNALLAAAVGVYMGLDGSDIRDGLFDFKPSGMRQHITEKFNITFIEDCYNASPTSMMASLNVLSGLKCERKIAVLGDMLELGTYSHDAHTETGQYAAKKCDAAVFCGHDAKIMYDAAESAGCEAYYFSSRTETAEFLKGFLRPHDSVLFKASHSMKFEEIISALYGMLEENKRGENK